MIVCFLMEIEMPLVIQGLLNSFFCCLDKGFRGACLSMVLSVTREKRLNNTGQHTNFCRRYFKGIRVYQVR